MADHAIYASEECSLGFSDEMKALEPEFGLSSEQLSEIRVDQAMVARALQDSVRCGEKCDFDLLQFAQLMERFKWLARQAVLNLFQRQLPYHETCAVAGDE